MSEHMHSGARAGAAPAPFAMGNIAPMIDAAARTGKACGKAYLAWQDEILRFTSTRLQRDAEFGSSLLRCDKWVDAARLQQDWMTATVEDYVSEANKLLELATSLTTDVARSSADHAGQAGEAAGAQAGALAEGVSRFTRSAGESAGAMADATRRAAEGTGQQALNIAEETRKAAEDMGSTQRDAARDRDRGAKRR